MGKRFKIYVFVALFIFGIFFVIKLSYAQTWVQTQDKIKENTQKMQNIESKIVDIKDNYRLLYEGAKNQNDQLGNQISFANYFLGGISLFFTFAGVFFAWYINRQYEKVKEMKDIVETTRKAIDDNATSFYKKLKREDTLDLFKRLEEVPEDIINIYPLLFSRDLLESDFLYLKNPYLKIKDNLPSSTIAMNSRNIYIQLLLQHFPYESLKDSDIVDEIVSNINTTNINNMFLRDIRRFFDQVLKYIKEFNINNGRSEEIVRNLFGSYLGSKFKGDIKLKDYIKELFIKYGIKIGDVFEILKKNGIEDLFLSE